MQGYNFCLTQVGSHGASQGHCVWVAPCHRGQMWYRAGGAQLCGLSASLPGIPLTFYMKKAEAPTSECCYGTDIDLVSECGTCTQRVSHHELLLVQSGRQQESGIVWGPWKHQRGTRWSVVEDEWASMLGGLGTVVSAVRRFVKRT